MSFTRRDKTFTRLLRMRSIYFLLLLAVAAVTNRMHGDEASPYQNAYRVWLEAGGLFTQNSNLDSFPGAADSSRLKLNPGVRVGLGSAYTFTPLLSVGWEVGVLGSSVDSVAGLDEFDAVITQVPFLINVALRYETDTGFTPFIGIGAGFASTAINIDEARSGTASVEGSDYDFVGAWQLAAGLRYDFESGLGLGILYKYLWTADAEWELDNEGAVSLGDPELKLDGLRSHALLAFVSYRF